MASVASEEAKILAGGLYLASTPELVARRVRARELTRRCNATGPGDGVERRRLLVELFAAIGDDVEIEPPFHCDYGTQIIIGAGVYANVGWVVLDGARVEIGDRTLLGPAVHLYAATTRSTPASGGPAVRLAARPSPSAPTSGSVAA